MNDLKPVNCIHCHTLLRGKYCYECGQKFITQEDKKIKHFVLTFFSSMFFADGKLFKTVKTVLTKPGELTYTYISGDRRKYLAPLQMFFFANLLYFLFPVLSTFVAPIFPEPIFLISFFKKILAKIKPKGIEPIK